MAEGLARKSRLGKERRTWQPPLVPESCATCPVGGQTVCRPFIPHQPEIVQEFKAGDRIVPPRRALYRQGEYCPELYNVLDGWIMLSIVLESGERQIIDFALPGGFIGYQSDLAAPMGHSAEAVTPVSVCVFPRRNFHSFLKAHPEVSLRLNEIIAEELERSRSAVVNLGSKKAFASLANLLVMLYQKSREVFPDQAGPDSAFVPLTQEQLASAIGTSNVHVSNLLKRLRTQGLAEFRTPVLSIRNYDGLLTAACYEPEI